jgi:hypothetical protein
MARLMAKVWLCGVGVFLLVCIVVALYEGWPVGMDFLVTLAVVFVTFWALYEVADV